MWKIITVIVIFIQVSGSLVNGQPTTCAGHSPEDHFDVSGKNMLFIHKEETFADAMSICYSLGMQLLTPITHNESKELSEYLNNRVNGFRYWNLWLAATDEKTEGQFIWETKNTTVMYSNWPKDEPNGGRNENCIELNWSNAEGITWNDCDCAGKRRFICEKGKIYVRRNKIVNK